MPGDRQLEITGGSVQEEQRVRRRAVVGRRHHRGARALGRGGRGGRGDGLPLQPLQALPQPGVLRGHRGCACEVAAGCRRLDGVKWLLVVTMMQMDWAGLTDLRAMAVRLHSLSQKFLFLTCARHIKKIN